jgi:hypothetical protein
MSKQLSWEWDDDDAAWYAWRCNGDFNYLLAHIEVDENGRFDWWVREVEGNAATLQEARAAAQAAYDAMQPQPSPSGRDQ